MRVKRLQDSLRVQAAEMDWLSRTDPLTGLHNRRHAEVLRAHEHGSRRHSYPLTVLLLDIDHFKQVNELQGHPAGDAVLRTIARCLTDTVRREDLVGRWGVAVCLTSAGVTISIGGASAVGAAADVLVPLADANLYEAEREGRNRVRVSEHGARAV